MCICIYIIFLTCLKSETLRGFEGLRAESGPLLQSVPGFSIGSLFWVQGFRVWGLGVLGFWGFRAWGVFSDTSEVAYS